MFVRCDGQVSEMIVRVDDVAPDQWEDRVCLMTSGVSAEDGVPACTDAENVPLWALADAVDGCDCYALAGLRWANRAQADVHDASCKCWKG